MDIFGRQVGELRMRLARMEEWLAAAQRERDHAEGEAARLRGEVVFLRAALDRRDDDLRRMTDAAMRAAGSGPVYFPAAPAPDPGEARPIRRLRDWRREMELLEAQAFARQQRGDATAADLVSESGE